MLFNFGVRDNCAVTGSYEKGAELAKRWGTAISDDAIHALVGRIAERSKGKPMPEPPPPKPQEQHFSLVIMIDGWMVRQRGVDWGVKSEALTLERVSWKEVKSAIIYRLEDRATNASGRGMLIEKKVVAVPPETDVLDLGARIQAQAMLLGLARAKEVFIVIDGVIWIWKLVEDCFSEATKTLDFYHGSEHLWILALHLHPDSPELVAAWINPILHELRHTPQHRLVDTLEELLAGNPTDPIITREVHITSKTTATISTMPTWPPATPRLVPAPRNLTVDVAVKNDTLQFLCN